MGCRCPPEFSGEHCEIPDKEGYHAKKTTTNRHSKKSRKGSDLGTVLSFSIVFAGGLAVFALLLVRHLRGGRYGKNPIAGLPGLPPSYRDDKHDDSDDDEDNNHSDDGVFVNAYEQQQPANMIAMEEYRDHKELPKIV